MCFCEIYTISVYLTQICSNFNCCQVCSLFHLFLKQNICSILLILTFFFCFLFSFHFYPTALKGCRDIVFTHGVRMGGRAAGNSLSGLYLGNHKV